jgi:formylglycine-generating enzyme required for sulfatase activity
MGSPETETDRRETEVPPHKVTIGKPFAVAKFEVTFDDWDVCVELGGCKQNKTPDDERWGRGNRPVINVNWVDAKEYAEWLSKLTGKSYRLLTEAEYEYATRAGTVRRQSFRDRRHPDLVESLAHPV